jgi:hypothetical protein
MLLGGTCQVTSGFADDEPFRFGGHVKFLAANTDYRADDVNALYGDDPARDQTLDLRLKAEARHGPWDGVVHYEMLAIAGSTPETRRNLNSLGLPTLRAVGLPDDELRLFNLTDEIADDPRLAAVQRLDRLSIGHTSPGQVIRFGRQAVSWGNGLVFHPFDFVNPFSPVVIDKEYKTGDDMLYGQWTLAAGGDIQAILLPRRDAQTHDVEGEESTGAVKLRQRIGIVDVDVLAARHYDENVAGLGVVTGIRGAVWRLDVEYTDLPDENGVWSAVTNLDTSWTWGGKNVYGYIEYFRNGFGETRRADYVTPNDELFARLERGELFTLARDYAAAGMQIELTPLFNLHVNVIRNLNDSSHYAQLRGVYDWQQNLQLMAGLDVPYGERGSEFGGIPVPGLAAYSAPGRLVYARLAYYF